MMPRKLGLRWALRQIAETAAVAGATWQQLATLDRWFGPDTWSWHGARAINLDFILKYL